jgi:hypothetical protein
LLEEGDMGARVAAATLQTIWDCRWSRPGYRVTGVLDHLQPEKLWICVRGGGRRGVTEDDCEGCPFWELESAARITSN